MAIDNKDKKVLNVPHLRFPEFSGEWKKYSFNDIAQYKKGPFGSALKKEIFVPKSADSVKIYEQQNAIKKDWELGRYYISRDYFINHMQQFIVEAGDIIVSCAGTIGEIYELPPNAVSGVFNQALMRVRINATLIDKNIFIKVFSSMIDSFSKIYSNGSAIKNIPPFADLKKTNVFLPTQNEQYKISRLISLLDERIATQNKIIEKLQSLIKGLIDDIITLKCGQLVAFETLYSKAGEGGTPTTSNTEFYDNGSIPFIKIEDLSNKYLSANKDYITELGLKKSSAWLIPTHSIIYSNGATIGAISINKYPVCTKQGILGIVPNTNIDVEFLYYFMQSSYFQKEVERVVTEGTMKTAYLKDINHIKCPIPDLDRQKEISHLLSVLSLKEDVERQLLQKYQIQKQYLLRKMFI